MRDVQGSDNPHSIAWGDHYRGANIETLYVDEYIDYRIMLKWNSYRNYRYEHL